MHDSSSEEFLAAYLERVTRAVAELRLSDLVDLADLVEATAADSGHIFFLGNGGSAATATHYVNDLVMAYVRTDRVVRTSSLTDNAALITGISNDYSFEDVFVYQLRALSKPGDLAVAISASGNSPNLVRALEWARQHGVRTAAIVGFDGGAIREMADVVVHGPTALGDYGPAEDVHLIVNHAVAGLLRERGSTS